MTGKKLASYATLVFIGFAAGSGLTYALLSKGEGSADRTAARPAPALEDTSPHFLRDALAELGGRLHAGLPPGYDRAPHGLISLLPGHVDARDAEVCWAGYPADEGMLRWNARVTRLVEAAGGEVLAGLQATPDGGGALGQSRGRQTPTSGAATSYEMPPVGTPGSSLWLGVAAGEQAYLICFVPQG